VSHEPFSYLIIPVRETRTGAFKKGDNIVLAAFGGGFTWGATWIKWAYDSN